MNVVDDFFAAPDWPTTSAIVHKRSKEFHENAAGTALIGYRDRLAGSDVGRLVFNMYLQILQTGVAQGLRAMLQLLESIGMMPKLTDRDVDVLGAATDARTARPLWTANPGLARALLANRVVCDDAFWTVLAAGARRVEDASGVGASPAGDVTRATVVVDNAGDMRRVLKVLPLSEGGLAVTTPYHRARDGFMFKSPRMRETGRRSLSPSELTPFSASDRVKLSYHMDGFAQFSGEDNARIVSGRDRDTGKPRGLGLHTNPLDDPIKSGPSIGCTVWGLDDFDNWRSKRGDQPLVFGEEDFYVDREQSRKGEIAHDFSMLMVPTAALNDSIGSFGSGTLVELSLPMRVGSGEHWFRARLVVLGGPATCVIIAERKNVNFRVRSGFTLSGPGDAEGSLVALYPRPVVADIGTSLNRLAQF